jgi:hypothetical protein
MGQYTEVFIQEVSTERSFRNTNAACYIAEDPSDFGVSVTCGMSVLSSGNGNSKSETLASIHKSTQLTVRIV